MKSKKTAISVAITAALSVSATAIAPATLAATLADGNYDMIINNTPSMYVGFPLYATVYDTGADGAWNSSFTTGCLPGSLGCSSRILIDDLVATPVNGKYAGNPGDGVHGTIGINVTGGTITSTGKFEFDMIPGTVGGDFQEYGPVSFTGSVTAGGEITLQPAGLLGTFGSFPSLVDEAWNIDNFNGTTGTNPVVNPPTSNTTYDVFSTGTATNGTGSINGAAYDGATAILVKGGQMGSEWDGFFGTQYFEVWNVSFTATSVVPIPATAWLFGSGLLGLIGIARHKKVT